MAATRTRKSAPVTTPTVDTVYEADGVTPMIDPEAAFEADGFTPKATTDEVFPSSLVQELDGPDAVDTPSDEELAEWASLDDHVSQDQLDDTMAAVQALPTVVDITTLDADGRKALIAQLAADAKAEREAARTRRNESRAAQRATKVDTSEVDAEWLTDIGTRLVGLDLVVTPSSPRGFRRYTGDVVIDGVTYNITATARVAAR